MQHKTYRQWFYKFQDVIKEGREEDLRLQKSLELDKDDPEAKEKQKTNHLRNNVDNHEKWLADNVTKIINSYGVFVVRFHKDIVNKNFAFIANISHRDDDGKRGRSWATTREPNNEITVFLSLSPDLKETVMHIYPSWDRDGGKLLRADLNDLNNHLKTSLDKFLSMIQTYPIQD